MFLVCVLLQVALVSVSASVSYLDCGSVYEIRAVNIAGCSSSQPCYLTLGDQVQVNLQFYAGKYLRARNLRQNVVIDINQLHLSATVTPERCEVPNCPARHSGSYTSFNSTMTVPSRMVLNQRGYLRWRITNEEGRLILCYAVLVQTRSRRLKYIRQYQSMIPGRQSIEPNE